MRCTFKAASPIYIPSMPLFLIYGPCNLAVPGSLMPVKQSVVWMGDISRGSMGESSQYPRPVCDNAANKYLIPDTVIEFT